MAVRNNRNILPVDRGWAWAIAAAGLVTHTTMGGAGQTDSVLFLEVLTKYNSSITIGSLMFMCSTLFFSISSVLTATFLMPTLKERRCVILGGLLCSALSLGASLSPNMGIFITMISLKGIGHGIIFVPAIALIPHYFKRLRSRASVVPWCGGSAASIIAPFIIRAVTKEYGVSGAYFILSAFELHYILAGLLLRPPSAYRFHSDQADGSEKDNSVPHNAIALTDDTKCAGHSEEAVSKENGSKLPPQVNSEGHDEEVEGIGDSLLTITEARHQIPDSGHGQIINGMSELKDETKDTEIAYRNRRNTFYGSALTLDSDVGAALELMLEDVTDNHSEKSLSRWQKLYQGASLHLWSFRWALVLMLPGTVNMYLLSYLPAISKFQGASLDEAALLVTIKGSVDLISRICFGVIADTHVLSPSKLLLITQLCLGIVCHLYRFATSFVTLVPVTIFIGMFVGARGPLQPLICIEVVGASKMAQAYSAMSILNTLIGPIYNPVLGRLAEATGSFVPVMHVIGSCYLLTTILIALLPLFVRLDVKHGRKM